MVRERQSKLDDSCSALPDLSPKTPLDGGPPNTWILGLVFATFSLILFSPLIPSSFQENDFTVLLAVSKGDPFGVWTHHGAQFFRPLVSFSFWLQYTLFGLNPIPYRVFNDLAHAGCATLCAVIAAEYLPGRKYLPWIAGFLFLLLPSHGEAINWICARGDLIAAFFGLLSILAFSRFLKSEKRTQLLAACGALLFGLMANESIVCVPLALGACLLWFPIRNRRTPSIALAASVAFYGALRWLLVGNLIDGVQDRVSGSKLVLVTLVQICRTVMPSLPSADVRLTNITFLKTAPGAGMMVAGLLLVAWAFRAAQKSLPSERFKALVAFSVAGFLAVAGLFVHLPFPFSERYVYFPSAFTCIALAIGIISAPSRPLRMFLTVSAVAAAGLILAIENQNWILAADLSHRLALSFSRDVVPKVKDSVYLASEPATVNGAEALGYQFPAVAELYNHRRLTVQLGGIEDILRPGNRTGLRASHGKTYIRSLDSNAVYDAGATGFITQDPTPEELSKSGLFKFELQEIGIQPHIQPSFFWNGTKFERIAFN